MTLGEVAQALGARLAGDPDVATREISGVAGIEQAGPSQVTFVANPRYLPLARSTRAAAILVDYAFEAVTTPLLRVDDPYLAFAKAIELFYQPPPCAPGVHPTAVIAPSARIGSRAHIGAYVVIGEDVVLGDDATLHPHVVIYAHVVAGKSFVAHANAVVREHCRLGDHVTLQNGAVVGADGFGFAKNSRAASSETEQGQPFWYKIVQSGTAVLEDHVEVQANACVDRASVGETRIGRGAKVDNLVQVGHGSTVGAGTLLCAQVGLAGSTVVGKNVILAGQVGVAGHCTVGDGAIATAQSGIPNDVAPGAVVSGYPAIDNRTWLKSVALFNRLPEIVRRLRGAQAGLWLTLAAALALAATGCHSAYMDATIVNGTDRPVSLVELDYPSASLGTQTLAPGATFHYRFKVQGAGALKLTWTDAARQEHSAGGPGLAEGDEGGLVVTIAPAGARFEPLFTHRK